MRVKKGDVVKVADIGTLGTVKKAGKNGVAAVVSFEFPEGVVECTIPVSIISSIVVRGKSYASS